MSKVDVKVTTEYVLRLPMRPGREPGAGIILRTEGRPADVVLAEVEAMQDALDLLTPVPVDALKPKRAPK